MRGALGWMSLALLLGGLVTSAWAQGYSIERDCVVIDRKEHWVEWEFPKDAVQITDDGRVRPRFIRKDINAVLDAGEFGGGIRAVGSNFGDASNIIDGDLGTYWEPDMSDPLRDWWVEIDLGRLVSATRIVLRFVDEGQGDPFLQFKVLTSNGDVAFIGSKLMDFELVGKTGKPNKHQRLFEYELSPSVKADEGWTGSILQYIRIAVTDSDFDKAEQIAKDEYYALDLERRGTIEYFGRAPSGKEWQVSREGYDALDPDERGPIRYYRREMPRLAEVEVWSVGDNISLGILDRGGSITILGLAAGGAPKGFDGDFMTRLDVHPYSPHRERGVLTVDFGALFWIDAIRLIAVGYGEKIYGRHHVRGYRLRGSDGSRAPDGTLIWRVLTPKSREDNKEDLLLFEDKFQLYKARFLEFTNLGQQWGYESTSYIQEFQIYGEGYVPEITLISGLIELGKGRSLTSIEWEAEIPPGTEIEIRTKTGDELREVKHFFNAAGKEITESQWNDLPGFSKGPITSEFVPGSGWSGWSQTYLKSGDPITSPSPRKYAMIQVRLLSGDPNLFPSLDSITLNFTRPLVREVVGEVSPDRDVPLGKPQDFVCLIGPTFLPTSPGFDQILISSPSGVRMELLGVSLGRERDFRTLKTEDFLPDEGGVFYNPSGDVLEVLRDRSDSLLVRLPRVVRIGQLDLVRIRFRSTLFLNGTVFEASVSNSLIPGSWQRVDSGDATALAPGQGMTVFTSIGDTIIGDVEIYPNPFTPNGDGVNDEVVFSFSVFKVNTDRPVGVTIYNLGGEVVKGFSERRFSAAGEYSITWSGEDEFGDVVSPGIYIARISIEADSESAKDSSVSLPVCVAY